ncbi:hypothetical protein D910_04520, partial [Dendroctonus ponderosae]
MFLLVKHLAEPRAADCMPVFRSVEAKKFAKTEMKTFRKSATLRSKVSVSRQHSDQPHQRPSGQDLLPPGLRRAHSAGVPEANLPHRMGESWARRNPPQPINSINAGPNQPEDPAGRPSPHNQPHQGGLAHQRHLHAELSRVFRRLVQRVRAGVPQHPLRAHLRGRRTDQRQNVHQRHQAQTGRLWHVLIPRSKLTRAQHPSGGRLAGARDVLRPERADPVLDPEPLHRRHHCPELLHVPKGARRRQQNGAPLQLPPAGGLLEVQGQGALPLRAHPRSGVLPYGLRPLLPALHWGRPASGGVQQHGGESLTFVAAEEARKLLSQFPRASASSRAPSPPTSPTTSGGAAPTPWATCYWPTTSSNPPPLLNVLWQVLPQHHARYLVFITEKYLGMQLLPADGNPFKYCGYLAHPHQVFGAGVAAGDLLTASWGGQVGDFALSHDGGFAFTYGAEDRSLLQWEVRPRAVELLSLIGGTELEPFYCLLEGGKSGWLFQEVQDLFFYMQILQQENIDLPRRVSDTIQLSEIPELVRTCGFYPSHFEVGGLEWRGRQPIEEGGFQLETMMMDIRYRDFDETGLVRDEVSFVEFVRLFVNHRPAYGYSMERLREAFGTMCQMGEYPKRSRIEKEDFVYLLQSIGDRLELPGGRAAGHRRRPTGEAGEAGEQREPAGEAALKPRLLPVDPPILFRRSKFHCFFENEASDRKTLLLAKDPAGRAAANGVLGTFLLPLVVAQMTKIS